jgi:hypothetical protein
MTSDIYIDIREFLLASSWAKSVRKQAMRVSACNFPANWGEKSQDIINHAFCFRPLVRKIVDSLSFLVMQQLPKSKKKPKKSGSPPAFERASPGRVRTRDQTCDSPRICLFGLRTGNGPQIQRGKQLGQPVRPDHHRRGKRLGSSVRAVRPDYRRTGRLGQRMATDCR